MRRATTTTLLAGFIATLLATGAAAQDRTLRPVTDAMLQNPEAGQ